MGLLLGVLAVSFAAILIRKADAPAIVIAAYRMGIAALLIWLLWPLHPDLILYRNRISIPAILGEIIAIPFWLKRFGYLYSRTDS